MKILLHRLGLLGDTLGADSVVPILKKQFGDDIKIDWMVRPGVQSLFSLDPHVDRVYVIKSRKFWYQLFFYFKNKFKKYDLIINLDASGKAYLLKWISAKQKLGFPFQTVSIPPLIHLFAKHQMLCRQLLKIVNDDTDELPLLYGAPFSAVKEKLKITQSYLVLALATSRTNKRKTYLSYRNWPLTLWENFLQVATKRLPFQLIIVGTKDDKANIESQITIPDGVINAMGRTNIPELITLVREASGVVTCDTGILHLASSTKTPIFALLGPSDPLRHGPFPVKNALHTVIRSGVHCSPCELTDVHKACLSNVCMQTITPENVCAVIKNRLCSSQEFQNK